MEPYHSPLLKSAIRLPSLNWNLSFFGGHLQQVNPGWQIDQERHLAFEIIQILSGQEAVKLPHQSISLTTGDILILPPNTPHEVTCLKPMEYFNFHFDLDDSRFVNQLLACGSLYYPQATPLNEALTVNLNSFHALINSQMTYSFQDELKVQCYLANFLLTLIQHTTAMQQTPEVNQVQYAAQIANNIKQTLQQQIYAYFHLGIDPRNQARLTIESILKNIQFSASYSFEIFKRVYGISPRTYFSKLKLQEAQRLLILPSLSVTEVSIALGYQSQSHFSRQFKRWCNCTPLEYRRKNKAS